MLPATLALEVKKQVLHYLGATFQIRDQETERALDRFFNDPEDGLFKGPWLKVNRPFRLEQADTSELFDIHIPWVPFKHQAASWRRLTTRNGNEPKPTLVTTGTGSGKTECYLYPLLDHCLRMQQEGKRDGIKAIVLYPMNALATDQANRFAEEILTSDQLSYAVNGKRKAHIRVGLYTGRMNQTSNTDEGPEQGTYREMTIIPAQGEGGRIAYSAITNRDCMQKKPPDILLTNYKMLDYLLLRPKDTSIWTCNQEEPSLLKYLVLDELHTYDGAQGADVACLIRRLKERFRLATGRLCVVGTSATVAGGDDEKSMEPIYKLCEFSGTLFEETIPQEAVIQEDRYRIEEVVRTRSWVVEQYPASGDCVPAYREDARAYSRRMATLFCAPCFPVSLQDPDWPEWIVRAEQRRHLSGLDDDELWGVALGGWIRRHPLFHLLLQATEAGAVRWFDLLRQISRADTSFAFRNIGEIPERGEVLMAFLALVAQARELRSGKPFPLVPTQVQLWLRELRRIGALVGETPVFSWLDNVLPEGKRQLPVVHCTECGEVAWVGLRDPDADSMIAQHGINGMQLKGDAQEVYEAWGFERAPAPSLVILSPWRDGDGPVVEYGQQELEATRWYLAPSSLVAREGAGRCPLTDENTFAVKIVHEAYSQENGKRVGVRKCPHCHEADSLMFIGSRAATLSSVAIDEVFGSLLNNDPKLLAFTDSVQDASHRAGFFSARTYHFTFRTALQHVIDDAGENGLPLPEVGERLLRYWGHDGAGRPGSIKRALETLIPPDLREYEAYTDFREDTHGRMSPGLWNDMTRRLTWEATSEFSLLLTHGRTMELHASATLGWEQQRVTETVALLQQRLPAVSPNLAQASARALTVWVLGVLHRQRERGGLYHAYLDSLAAQRFWGKHPFGRVVAGRETWPAQGRYKPRLMTTLPNRDHDHVLAPPRSNQTLPWQLQWARRVLKLPTVDDATLVDLVDAFLQAGESCGLLIKVHEDGGQVFYAVSDTAARLCPQGRKLAAHGRGYKLYRPQWEAELWDGAPSLAYLDKIGRYEPAPLTGREEYYRDRYRKGALRRVFAHEHTGLLATTERENLEYRFNKGGHADDPNVLTATSTLEMGIDIGDLSTAMLCSVPPTTANYLQRIGRAGRKTGTALVLSVINQRPHDLFFYARPEALIAGAVEPPGCWLDASAVLVRQYLAFCFDEAVREKVLADLPTTGKQLIDEIIQNKSGHIPGLLHWMLDNEQSLQQRFLNRFSHNTKDDTRQRFLTETKTERLRERIEIAAGEFLQQRKLLDNAKRRLKTQKEKLDITVDKGDLHEIEREQKILAARQNKLNQISALEVLTEHGLLPNYAFPERGVRFTGAIYHQKPKQGSPGAHELETKEPFELVRGGSAAIRELAPWNHFYTHSHRFDIQQVEIGSHTHPLVTEWGVCGQCGHMRPMAEIDRPDAVPACPQCGFDGIEGQSVRGQQASFLEFARSQAISYMEFYDSLSADKGDERESEIYQLVSSFDQTVEQATGAVADDDKPFGIEYRAAMILREVNTGYRGQHQDLAFGGDVKVSSEGFVVCADCGVVTHPSQDRARVKHRKSCSGHRETQKRRREGRTDDAYDWQNLFLYRELRSEAIRLLLPDVEPEDLSTLEAAIYLGMRLRFQGDPGHLLVKQQIVPDLHGGVTQSYLVMMDAVPGGTGFLKELFQASDGQGRMGEGIMEVMRLALTALETCSCRELQQTKDDTDGCYRCLRTYHLQYRAEEISRERGIRLLTSLIEAGEKRQIKAALDDIKQKAKFDSQLEKRFVTQLQGWVEEHADQDSWREELIAGALGYRFTLGDGRLWSLELQPRLGSAQGVAVACQPDFLLTADDEICRPVAIFLDGFEPHVHPTEPDSRLSDDLRKRRAILESEGYWVWSISWEDLRSDSAERFRFLNKQTTDANLPERLAGVVDKHLLQGMGGHGLNQFKAFLRWPRADLWRRTAQEAVGFALMIRAGSGTGQSGQDMQDQLRMWRSGYALPPLGKDSQGEWTWLAQKLSEAGDVFAYGLVKELIAGDYANLAVELRLGDSAGERSGVDSYKQRWRRFHASMNLFQFARKTLIYTTSEVEDGAIPEPVLEPKVSLDTQWQVLQDEAVGSVSKLIPQLAAANCAVPEDEYYSDDLPDDYFAELAWPDADTPVAILAGTQEEFAKRWQQSGWRALTMQDIEERGVEWCIERLPQEKGK